MIRPAMMAIHRGDTTPMQGPQPVTFVLHTLLGGYRCRIHLMWFLWVFQILKLVVHGAEVPGAFCSDQGMKGQGWGMC